MKGKLIVSLFALPFLGFGGWMAYSIGSSVWQAQVMRDWQPVEARLERAGIHTHSGEDSDTYEAYAEYRYAVDGRTWRNDRVAIGRGADNIGEYQREVGRRLALALERNEPITVFVDPGNPAAAIYDRNLRWGLLGFRSIFVVVFGGVGVALLAWVLLSKDRPPAPEGVSGDKPWLADYRWQTASIGSSSKTGMYVAWACALFWNAVSAPLPFLVLAELKRGNAIALAGLLFPLIGICLLAWAARKTLEWRRFGAAPVLLDPFPGSIGGHVGGTIDLALPYDAGARFMLTLTNVSSYVSGSGKNRERSERAVWQDSRIAHTTTGAAGTRVTFRFDVPGDLAESDATRDGDAWHLWRLSLTSDLPGIDVDRDYEIPVYATGQASKQLPETSLRDANAEQARLDDRAVARLVRLRSGSGGRRMLFPAGRNLVAGIGGIAFGAVFIGSAWFLLAHAGQAFMGAIFGLVGGLIVLSGLYFCLNSLEVVQEGRTLRTVRRVLGIPVRRREMSYPDFAAFDKSSSMQSRSGSRHVMHYSVHAVDRAGARMLVGEGFRGAGQADAAIRLLTRELDLQPEPGFPFEPLVHEVPQQEAGSPSR